MFRPSRKEKIILSALGALIAVVWAPVLFSRADRRGGKGPSPSSPQDAAPAPAPGPADERLGSSAQAQWGENPFVADRSGAGSSGAFPPNRGETGFTLSGILWDAESPSAVINNQVVGVGERLDRWQVTEIRKDRVVLSDGSATQTLRAE